MNDTNVSYGNLTGSAQGNRNVVRDNNITVGPDTARDLTRELQARLDELKEALDRAAVDDRTRILADDQVDKLKKAAGHTPPDASVIRSRWVDLTEALSGVAKAGTSIGEIVDSLGKVVGALTQG